MFVAKVFVQVNGYIVMTIILDFETVSSYKLLENCEHVMSEDWSA